MRGRRLGVRWRLLIGVVGVLVLSIALAVAAFNFLLGQRLSASATVLAKAQAEAELSTLQVSSGQLVSTEGPEQGTVAAQVWVFAGRRALEKPRADPELNAAAQSLAGGPERALDVGEEIRLYALPVVQTGTRYGTVVSAISLTPYEETERAALAGSLILAGLLLAGVTILTRWILGRALLPVSRMTADAASWSEHDLERRFDLGEPYDELTRLSATLDALLERLAASLRHEQRFTAELSHELRTPLAKIAGETELALRRERTQDEYRASLEAIRSGAAQMTRTVEALVAAARQDAGLTRATVDVRQAIRRAVDFSALGVATHHLELRVSLPDDPVPVAIEPDLLERILHTLLDNALLYGRGVVWVELVRSGASARVTVTDDGQGVAADEVERIFEPGVRGRAAVAKPGGAGLGLALARRLARSAGGEISAEPAEAGGRFTVNLPLAG